MPIPTFDDRRLYLLLTRGLCVGDPLQVLEAALGAGVDLVQVREKPFGEDGPAWIQSVLTLADRYGVPVLINDRIDLAIQTHSCGVHLGQDDLRLHAMGSLTDRDHALGLSTHDTEEMDRALIERPDYVGVGPCFPTETKGYTKGLVAGQLETLLARSPVPAYGIGGIHAGNLPDLLARGLRHIAVSSCILASPAPAQATAELRRILDTN